MNTHYHYRDGVLQRIELCFDDASSLLLPSPVADVPQPETPQEPQEQAIPAPPVLEQAPDPPETFTRPQRARMGVVRTVKTLAFSVGGEASVYVLNNYTQLSLPPGIGLAVGAAAYGVNKYLRPDNGGIL